MLHWVRRDKSDGSESSELTERVKELAERNGLTYEQVRADGRFETSFALYYLRH